MNLYDATNTAAIIQHQKMFWIIDVIWLNCALTGTNGNQPLFGMANECLQAFPKASDW